MNQTVKYLARFTSNIWQIHPFLEGNTRATAVFLIKYLKTLGLDVNNNVFAEHSWYFRNALVRANYNDLKNRVHADTRYLEQFFENLLLGAAHELKNRYMHLDYPSGMVRENSSDMFSLQSCSIDVPKSQIDTLECTLTEVAALNAISANPEITQKQLAEEIGISLGSIKRITISLQEKGLLQRVGGKRFGAWIIKR